MRQFGLDLARARPTWRRWRFRRTRVGDLCDLLEKFYPEFNFPEFGCAEFPPDLGPGVGLEFIRLPRGGRMRFEFLLLEAGVGIGCPSVLIQQAFIGQDPLGVFSLAQAGVAIADAGRRDRFSFAQRRVHQTRFISPDVIRARRCDFGGSDAQGRELAATLDGLTSVELGALGFV